MVGVGLGSRAKPCLLVFALIACVTLVSMFYLQEFSHPMQLIHPHMLPIFSNTGEKKNDTSTLCKNTHIL
jgi:hypothetical protein